MEVRRAVAADAAACRELVQRAYALYLPRMSARPGPMTADYDQVVAEHETWVVDDGGSVAGLLVLSARGDHLVVENVAVDPASQGRGVGRRLLTLAEERAAELGVPRIRLFTHVTMVENQRLYERIGYVETARGDDGVFARVFYEKRL
jgi:ribosomal protein S18 acetylase RimI-like enzyme